MAITHLVIPDSHCQPGVSNERFTWLGEYIVETKPDVIINIGDMADMKSLSMYDVGKLSAEGRRYKDDIASMHDALAKLHAPIEAYNKQQRKLRKKQYKPELHFCLGNHEHRIVRATQEEPKYYGTISLDDLGLKERGWQVHPFLQPVIVDDVAYSHYFPSGVMMRPIGGKAHAQRLLDTQFMSCCAGHSHLRGFADTTNVAGRRFCATIVGCFFEHQESWAGQANNMYWRGIVVHKHVSEGSFDPEFIPIHELRRTYGKT